MFYILNIDIKLYSYRTFIISFLVESKYRNLCSLCDNSASCYVDDKYYGRDGAILCLTDNVGDIAWVRLDDVLQYFKVKMQ